MGLGCLLLHALGADGLQGGYLVGHLAHRVNQQGVVGLNGDVHLGGLALELGAQPSGVKNRQADGRAHAPLLAARFADAVKAYAVQPGKGHQIDVGVEQSFGHLHFTQAGFHPRPRSRNVWPVGQQVQGNGLRRGNGVERVQRRGFELLQAQRLAGERGQCVARQGGLLAQALYVLANFGQIGFAGGQL